jgi:hypothetical protein
MYVIAQHVVKDVDFFFADIPAVARNAPAGVHPQQFCPSTDQTTAVCLWEADSVDSVKAYLDRVTGDAAENTYFQVSDEHAIGLPTSLMASAR